jgi:hypothetical protein
MNGDEDNPNSFLLDEEIQKMYDTIVELSSINEERQLALQSAFRIIMRLMQIANTSEGITFTTKELEDIDSSHKLEISSINADFGKINLKLITKLKSNGIQFVDAQNTEYAKKILEKAKFD